MMLSAAAQPSGERPQMPERPQMKERPTVEQEAQIKTDQMAAELGLDEKQIKKVYKFFKSDIQYRRETSLLLWSRSRIKFCRMLAKDRQLNHQCAQFRWKGARCSDRFLDL